MALENGKDISEKVSHTINKKRKYFFINNHLYRLVKANRSTNMVYAFDIEKKEITKYTYSDYKKFKKRAFTIKDVSILIRRHPDRIRKAFNEGMVKKPMLADLNGRNGIYYFSEENIYDLRNHFATVHMGKKRKDGMITPKSLPSVQELDALLGKTEMLYIRTQEGNFVPVWKTEEFE